MEGTADLMFQQIPACLPQNSPDSSVSFERCHPVFCQDRLPDALVGRQLNDGSWVGGCVIFEAAQTGSLRQRASLCLRGCGYLHGTWVEREGRGGGEGGGGGGEVAVCKAMSRTMQACEHHAP